MSFLGEAQPEEVRVATQRHLSVEQDSVVPGRHVDDFHAHSLTAIQAGTGLVDDHQQAFVASHRDDGHSLTQHVSLNARVRENSNIVEIGVGTAPARTHRQALDTLPVF